MSGHGMLLTAVPSRDAAARIATLLVEERLAACVQVLPIESVYRWEGKIHNEAELLLLVKTRTALFDTATARIRTVHPYSVPEIVCLPFTTGFGGYLDWIDAVTSAPHDSP
ncbi:MAG TPA: divalent-cation tolerance protein CutA [Rhizomicrobium sp.]